MFKSIFRLHAVAAVALTCGFQTMQAATLTAVPMQGGMVMPMVAYHAEHGRLHVVMPMESPELTPLMVSNPGDGFDPADPWFDSLDPSRQGQSFSRRYGFVMDTTSDPLPENTAIWLRKLAGSPELSFYRYSGSAPKVWQPIFGTAGAPNAMSWSGMMFHPGVTAPPGANDLTATFQAYLVDTSTGHEVPDSGSDPVVFKWTNRPDGRPALQVVARVVVAWPADASGYVPEWADTLTTPVWTAVTNAPVMLDGKPSIVLAPGDAAKFFRMRKAP